MVFYRKQSVKSNGKKTEKEGNYGKRTKKRAIFTKKGERRKNFSPFLNATA